MLKTADGGKTWQEFKDVTYKSLRGISCPNASTCYAVGGSGIVITTADGGQTWQEYQTSHTSGNLLRVACTDNKTCISSGVGGDTVVTTSNGGLTWEERATGLTRQAREDLTGLTCYPPTSCLGVSRHGPILATRDSGLTWNSLVPKAPTNLRTLSTARH